MRQVSRVVLVASVFSGACAGYEDGETDSVEMRGFTFGSSQRSGDGGRTGGDWIINGLSDPAVCGVDPSFPLSSAQGLGSDGWLDGDDPDGEDLIRYMVECALEKGDQVTVNGPDVQMTFEGALGLAPEWKDAPCDEECQRWVSACLLARTNAEGDEIPIFVQGAHPNLGFGDNEGFPNYEATFFGNVFSDPEAMHACQGDPASLEIAAAQGRICARDPDDCGFTIHAHCQDTVCDTSLNRLAALDCQPDPTGPSYPGITVHVADVDRVDE